MRPRFPKILYFIDGVVPSEDDYIAAEKFGPGTVFRNARHTGADQPLENADGVEGKVPDTYKKMPRGNDALEAFDKKMREHNDEMKKRASAKKKADKAASDAEKEAAEAEAERKAKEEAAAKNNGDGKQGGGFSQPKT